MGKSLSFILTLVVLIPIGSHAASFKLDPSHTKIAFEVKHLVFATVEGRFNKFEGGFEYDADKKMLDKLNVSIDAASVDTNEPDRDKHLRSADFFDVEKTPKLTFVAKSAASPDGKTFAVKGDLTIHGVTKPVTLMATNYGMMTDPWGNKVIIFEATTDKPLNRKDFGLNWNKALEAGGVLVGDDIKIKIQGEALLQVK